MKVSIPILEIKNNLTNITPIGIKFNSIDTEDKFITNINIDYNNGPITYVVLDNNDFD